MKNFNRASLARSTLTGIAAMFIAGGAEAAGADCQLRALQIPTDGVVVAYDPFDRETLRAGIPLRFTSSGCEDARLEVAVVPELESLSPGGELQASNGAESLPVVLNLDGMQITAATDLATAFDLGRRPARLAGRSGQLQGQGLQVELPYGADVAPGRYRARANLIVRVIGEDGQPGAAVSAPFFIEVDVQPSFRLAAGVERPRLWLGELTEGERSQTLTFLAFSNTRYLLTVRSEHGGRMTLNGSDGRDAPGVPYGLSISGRDLNWVDGEGELRFPEPRFLVRTHEVVAVTGSVDSRRPAGDYRDWVTIEISPLIS